MWTIAVDSDSLVRFLNRNVATVEKLQAILDGEEPDDDLMMEYLGKIHQSLAGMVSYLKLRKENESEGLGGELEAVESTARDREVASGHRQDLAGGDRPPGTSSGGGEQLGRLKREALQAATFRNRGKKRGKRRVSKR